MKETNTLCTLLSESNHFAPIYSVNDIQKLSNHLPMALIALDRLGASEQRLKTFYRLYSQKLKQIDQFEFQITEENWLDHLGNLNAYSAYVNFFHDELLRLGKHDLLHHYLDVLSPAFNAHAFHPMIRLAYGLEINDENEIIAGLSYLSISYWNLLDLDQFDSLTDDPKECLFHLCCQQTLKEMIFKEGIISVRMKHVAENEDFLKEYKTLIINENTLKQMARTTAELYQTFNDFTALHTVTATHALQLVLPFIRSKEDAIQHVWAGICCAYVTIGCPETIKPNEEELSLPNWDEIVPYAIQSDDEHVIKLVYTCYEQGKIYDDLLFQWLATREIGLL